MLSPDRSLGAIPPDRPVLGTDVLNLREQLGLMVDDFMWMMGLSVPQWHEIRHNPHAPVKDPAIALLTRLLSAHPEVALVPPEPGVERVFSMFERFGLTKKQLSLWLGRDSSAVYRYLQQGSQVSSQVKRLLQIMEKMMVSPETMQSFVESYRDLVEVEARARGIGDLNRAGRWTDDGSDAKKARSQARSGKKKDGASAAAGKA